MKSSREAEEAKEKARIQAEEAELAAGTELYEGIVKLTIMPPIDFGMMRKLQECLHQVENLRLVLVSGSVQEGSIIVISVEKPIPLIDVLRAMPPVEQVIKKDMKIMVTLKAPTAG